MKLYNLIKNCIGWLLVTGISFGIILQGSTLLETCFIILSFILVVGSLYLYDYIDTKIKERILVRQGGIL